MTEEQWLSSDDPQGLVRSLTPTGPNRRKILLFACACCRRAWHLLPDSPHRQAVELCEQYADGLATRQALWPRDWGGWPGRAEGAQHEGAMSAVERVVLAVAFANDERATSPVGKGQDEALEPELEGWGEVGDAVHYALQAWDTATAWSASTARLQAERKAQAALLRDLFGPLPFRPVEIDPSWRTPTVVALATAIYEERRWEEMGVLGDALQEAGCTDAGVLEHCRGPGPHSRGCWLVDLLLKKE